MSYRLNFKHTLRGIDVLQAVYAFILALGLREIFLGSYVFLNTSAAESAWDFLIFAILPFLLFVNVVLLGIRFFWVPRNLRRLLVISAGLDKSDPDHHRPTMLYISNLAISVHWFIIVIHAALYFLICSEFNYISFVLSSNQNADVTIFFNFVTLQIILLSVNGAWIYWITQHERHYFGQNKEGPTGRFWAYNNLVCCYFAFAPFSLLNNCRNAADVCLSPAATQGSLTRLVPIGADHASYLFHLFSNAIGESVTLSHEIMYWFASVLIMNSLIDLGSTSKYYFIYEDVEWEAT